MGQILFCGKKMSDLSDRFLDCAKPAKKKKEKRAQPARRLLLALLACFIH